MPPLGRTRRPEPRTTVRRARGDRGAVAVEMALVLPVLCLLTFGIVDFGRLVQQQIALTEAVREGARVGALNGTAADAQARINSVLSGTTVTYPTLQVCTTSSGFSDDSKVTAQITFAPITPVFAVMGLFGNTSAGTVKLSATGIMNCVG